MTDEERKDEELERKLRAYFQAEEGEAPPPGDLWERLSPQLAEQEPPRWGFRLPTFGMSRLPMAHGAVAAVLVLLIAGRDNLGSCSFWKGGEPGRPSAGCSSWNARAHQGSRSASGADTCSSRSARADGSS